MKSTTKKIPSNKQEILFEMCEKNSILSAPNKYIYKLLTSFNNLNMAITTMEETKTCSLEDLGNLCRLRYELEHLFKFEGAGYYKDAELPKTKEES
jgi:hypothetical protein|tara:strand:+ start:624 stop:911 length:288 start_codon:yes stop_codon:yes gene_type:complete